MEKFLATIVAILLARRKTKLQEVKVGQSARAVYDEEMTAKVILAG